MWKIQTVQDAKPTAETGGGEQIAVEEENASISEIYANMVARGVIGAGVAHATTGLGRTDERRAYSMMKNAGKNPKYMEYAERQIQLQKLDKMEQELQELKLLKETKLETTQKQQND